MDQDVLLILPHVIYIQEPQINAINSMDIMDQQFKVQDVGIQYLLQVHAQKNYVVMQQE
jgi:hypothetical protein